MASNTFNRKSTHCRPVSVLSEPRRSATPEAFSGAFRKSLFRKALCDSASVASVASVSPGRSLCAVSFARRPCRPCNRHRRAQPLGPRSSYNPSRRARTTPTPPHVLAWAAPDSSAEFFEGGNSVQLRENLRVVVERTVNANRYVSLYCERKVKLRNKPRVAKRSHLRGACKAQRVCALASSRCRLAWRRRLRGEVEDHAIACHSGVRDHAAVRLDCRYLGPARFGELRADARPPRRAQRQVIVAPARPALCARARTEHGAPRAPRPALARAAPAVDPRAPTSAERTRLSRE